MFEDKIKLAEGLLNTLCSFLRCQNGHTPQSKKEGMFYEYIEQFIKTAQSFLRISPGSKYFVDNLYTYWNPSQMCSIVRNLWDIWIAYRYHVASTKNENDFTFKQLVLHYIAEKERFEMISFKHDSGDILKRTQEYYQKAKEMLENDAVFKTIDQNYKKKILKGEITPRTIVCEKSGIPKNDFNQIYKYLSNHTHFYGYAVSQTLVFDLRNPACQEMINNIFNFYETILARMMKEIELMVPGSELYWQKEFRDIFITHRQYLSFTPI